MVDLSLKMLLLGEDRSASRALKGVGGAAGSAGEHIKSAGSHVRHMVEAFGALEAVHKAADFLKESTKAAIEDQAAQRKLALALHNTTGATHEQIGGVQEWLGKQSEALGVSKDELMPAFQRLAESTGSVTKAQKEMGIALDVSAGTGKNLNVVSMALMKANNGTTSSLARLGLKTKDAHGNTLSLTDALKKMSETFHGQAEARANSFQGVMDRLHTTVHELEVRIGTALIPILTTLATWVLDVGLPMIEHLVEHFQHSGTAVSIFATVFHVLSEVIRVVIGFVRDEVIPLMKQMYASFVKAVGGTKGLHDMFVKLQPVIAIVKVALGILWAGIKAAGLIAIPVMVHAIKNMIDIISLLAKAFIWLWNTGIQPVIKFILTAIGWVLNRLGDLFAALGHLPHMGWAKQLGDDLHNAADQADNVAKAIKKIPTHWNSTVTVTKKAFTVDAHGVRHPTNAVGGEGVGMNARGTNDWRGGLTWVGEEGRELVDIPAHSKIADAQASARMDAGSQSDDPGYVVVVVRDEQGHVLESKLTKVKRSRGNTQLEFEKLGK